MQLLSSQWWSWPDSRMHRSKHNFLRWKQQKTSQLNRTVLQCLESRIYLAASTPPSHTCVEAHASSYRLSTHSHYFPCSTLDGGRLLGRLGWLLICFTEPREGGVKSALLLRYQSCCCAYLAAHRCLKRSCWFGRFFYALFPLSLLLRTIYFTSSMG